MGEKSIKTVLLVEDEKPLLEIIKTGLEANGFNVFPARTMEQAYSYLGLGGSADAIWLDHYLLGEESGFDFVTELKAPGNPWEHTPIFIVSNTANPDTFQAYTNLGISKYYIKAEHKLESIINEIKSFLNNPGQNL